MPKSQRIFICENCDAQFLKWEGRCRECGKWSTLKETTVAPRPSPTLSDAAVVNLAEVSGASAAARFSSGYTEFDRVLGGGFVPGELILVGGDPGIGKSTLLLQVAKNLAANTTEASGILYVSGEESAEQIKQRLDRLGKMPESFHFLGEPSLPAIQSAVARFNPRLVVVDSLQTIRADGGSIIGKPAELRAATENLLTLAKTSNLVILLIGHVTKEGSVAGPKAVEHLVDAVMYLERGAEGSFRILRAIKNRFGGVSEIGVWQMTGQGLTEVVNPSAAFLTSGREAAPGSCVTALVQGSRVFLVEIQALVSKTRFGYPQRRATGLDPNRFQMILAVLTKIVRLPLAFSDIHLNVVGGIKSNEPATDLAVALAIASASKNSALQKNLIAIGEIGLQGELRAVSELERRLEEAARLGFKIAITPPQSVSLNIKNLEQLQAKTISEAIDIALTNR